MVANIVALGIIVELTKVVSVEALESAVLSRAPKGTEELNTRAFRTGVRRQKSIAAGFTHLESINYRDVEVLKSTGQ